MKKVYSIYEQGLNDEYETVLNLEFDNLKDAEEFCNLKNCDKIHITKLSRRKV